MTATHREGSRLIKNGKSDYLLPTVIHASSPEPAVVKKEFMFPFVTVVECPESKMLDAIGPTLVCTAITCNESFKRRLLDAVHMDRLNFGPRPDDAVELASATRRQHRRIPVPRPRVPVGDL